MPAESKAVAGSRLNRGDFYWRWMRLAFERALARLGMNLTTVFYSVLLAVVGISLQGVFDGPEKAGTQFFDWMIAGLGGLICTVVFALAISAVGTAFDMYVEEDERHLATLSAIEATLGRSQTESEALKTELARLATNAARKPATVSDVRQAIQIITANGGQQRLYAITECEEWIAYSSVFVAECFGPVELQRYQDKTLIGHSAHPDQTANFARHQGIAWLQQKENELAANPHWIMPEFTAQRCGEFRKLKPTPEV